MYKFKLGDIVINKFLMQRKAEIVDRFRGRTTLYYIKFLPVGGHAWVNENDIELLTINKQDV